MCLTKLEKNNYFLFEIFIVFRLMALMLPVMSKSLLIQDKLCLFTYNQSEAFCQNIHLEMNDTAQEAIKDVILADATRFNIYSSVIESVAMISWSLFVGSFLDRFSGGTFVIMSINLFVWFSGGIMSFNATAYRYITITTPEQQRTIKFVILEIIFVCCNVEINGKDVQDVSLATFLSGKLVSWQRRTPAILRSYHLNFIIAVTVTIGCFFKRRPNNLRLQIYLLCSVLFNQVLVTNGLNAVLLQFSEKVYQWSGSQYATFSAIQQMTQMSLLGLLLILLINVLKLEQSTLILLSQVSILVTDLIRGLFLSQLAFFVTLPIGILNGVGAISTKTKLASVIPEDEIGKIFSISSVIEAMIPFAASLIYSTIFTLSIASFPGAIYLFSCVVMIVSMLLLLAEKLFCPVAKRVNSTSEN
ncbi:hypothetical protein TYRP_019246 [Tyrophagus putrescentiae]|nr:hypothetical protein TYRP_019246 [Tyrophagus putrescentiae]